MHRRSSTTCLPLLALLVAFTLLSHDAVMAAGPHDTAAHAGHHDDGPADDTACGELIAARTNDGAFGHDVATAPGDAVSPPSLLACDHVPEIGGGVAEPAAPRRAILQTWLN